MSPGRSGRGDYAPVIVQLRHQDGQLGSPAGTEGRRHAVNGTTDLAAGSLAALLDQLDWLHAI
jgi:hypothetical protein